MNVLRIQTFDFLFCPKRQNKFWKRIKSKLLYVQKWPTIQNWCFYASISYWAQPLKYIYLSVSMKFVSYIVQTNANIKLTTLLLNKPFLLLMYQLIIFRPKNIYESRTSFKKKLKFVHMKIFTKTVSLFTWFLKFVIYF